MNAAQPDDAIAPSSRCVPSREVDFGGGGNYFIHLATAIKGDQVQIPNNHGHVNGWTNIQNVNGKVIKVAVL